jgi:hypothetical protein
MPALYKIDKPNRFVISIASDPLSPDDILRHQQLLADDPEFDPSYSQLLDFSEVTLFNFTAADVRILAQANLFSPNSRRAIVAKSEVIFGLARMFEAFRDLAGESGIRVFRDRNEALDWVLAKRPTT